MSYLPSKQFILTAGSVAAVVTLAWFALGDFHWPRLHTQDSLEPSSPAPKTPYEVATSDSDNDGLRDWEETLWGTDPHNPDTDGDGVLDGAEVEAHRNPTIAGSNDALPSQNEGSNIVKPGSLTDKLIQDLGIQYFTTKGLSEGEPLTQTQKSDTANSIANSFEQNIQSEEAKISDPYTLQNVLVSNTKSPKEYGNAIGGAMQTSFASVEGLNISEIDIVQNAATSKDMSLLKQLDPFIQGYKKMISFMKQTSAPSSYAQIHLDFMNTFQNLQTADEKMKLLETDPAESLVGVRVYAPQATRFVDILRNLKAQFDKDRVSFSGEDPGVFLNKYFKAVSTQ